MLWLQYQLSYPVRCHVLLIFNEKTSKKKDREKQIFLGETERLEADASFPCQEDMVKIPDSRPPVDNASLLCFPSGKEVQGALVRCHQGPGLCRDR